MSAIVPLTAAGDRALFGSKAANLARCARAGLPVPAGVALSCAVASAVARGETGAVGALRSAMAGLRAPWAVRSSAPDEDGETASFAGQHTSLIGVADDLAAAAAAVVASASSAGALAYRQRRGLGGEARTAGSMRSAGSVGSGGSARLAGPDGSAGSAGSGESAGLAESARPMAVIVQSAVRAVTSGVAFTRDPVSGRAVIRIEASWGIGIAVVEGLVIPDQVVIEPDGRIGYEAGLKDVAFVLDGMSLAERDVPPERAAARCLEFGQLAELTALDLEWAFDSAGSLHLLQARPITGP